MTKEIKPSQANLSSFETLVEIISRLRGPQGCPWDKRQTHFTIRDSLLEETYEVLKAIEDGSKQELAQELGDLLLQVVLHAQIASDEAKFDIGAVIRGINTKLIRRHPHVFADTEAASVEDVLSNWEDIKKKERMNSASMLDGVPLTLPALAYSQAVQKRVSRVGFDWPNEQGVKDKICEEIDEISRADTEKEKEEEYGDLLFSLANLARRQGIDLESALRGSNWRFYRRFSAMESLCSQEGLDFKSLTLEEKDVLWERVKKLEK